MLTDVQPLRFMALNSKLFSKKQITVTVARLDELHPIVSGNKLYKLHYFLADAIKKSFESVLTFGGAYSNHLVATAYACKKIQLGSKGIVRGERPALLSHTLRKCELYGMKLLFVPRNEYESMTNIEGDLYATRNAYPGHYIIPEGGYGKLGALGAGLIMNDIEHLNPTHICTAVGTATTYAGLFMSAREQQEVIAVPVIKGMTDIKQRLEFLGAETNKKQLTVWDDYHFGGYAKKNADLFKFMNELFSMYNLPTDFVYTGKMMYALFDKIEHDYFHPGANIICLHTGGLQGNASQPAGSFIF